MFDKIKKFCKEHETQVAVASSAIITTFTVVAVQTLIEHKYNARIVKNRLVEDMDGTQWVEFLHQDKLVTSYKVTPTKMD